LFPDALVGAPFTERIGPLVAGDGYLGRPVSVDDEIAKGLSKFVEYRYAKIFPVEIVTARSLIDSI